MGKWAKKRAKNTIKDEIYNRLSKLFKAGNGRSRNVDKRNGVDREYIYSSSSTWLKTTLSTPALLISLPS